MKLRYTDRAKLELESAFDWYEKQRRGLGYEFLDCVEHGIQSILGKPEIYQTYYANFRACIIRRFPFSIFYTIEDTEIIIHAVFDNRRDPRKKPKPDSR